MRVDRDGDFCNKAEFEHELQGLGIMVDAISGEAHWQLSVCENMLRLIQNTATNLARDIGETCSAEEAFGLVTQQPWV